MIGVTAILLLAIFATGTTQAQFSLELNPTGDPIGGGPGYRDIKTSAQADYVVSTKSDLLSALNVAVSGEIIYVDDAAEIDLTGEQDLIIPGGVTLASGRGRNGSLGALIYSNSLYSEGSLLPLFKTGGTNVRITGLRLRGPFADIGDHDYALVGVSLAIRSYDRFLEIDNNELWAWNKWAIFLYEAEENYVHHNYIHHNRLNGYGYGVWVGGSGGVVDATARIEANLFDFNRHSIGSTGDPDYSWIGRYNIQLEHALNHNFDRHDTNANEGGGSTHAAYNLFLGYGKNIVWDGVPDPEMRINNNWFIAPEDVAIEVRDAIPGVNYFNYDNTYTFNAPSVLPVAQATASTYEGTAPLTVNFDASGSYDQEGGTITQYHWNFGDGDILGDRAFGVTAQHTFTEPGRYNVELRAYNDAGIPGKVLIPITVHPASGGYVLSAWIKDTYIGPLTGHYSKQILIDGTMVWEDDAAGNEGWQHVVLDVSAQVAGRTEAEIAFRLYSRDGVSDPGTQVIEIHMYIDDVFLSGGLVENGGFEESGWPFRQSGSSLWSTGIPSEEVRSGNWAYRLRKGYLKPTNAGDYIEIFQVASIGEASPPGSTTQSINLQQGWNIVSLAIAPSAPSMEAIFADVLAEIGLVKNNAGQVFDPNQGTNTIGVWNTLEAYMVYTNADVTLTVEGEPIVPEATPIPLTQGWNLIPYFPNAALPIQDALTTIQAGLILAKDNAGQVYSTSFNINDIGTLAPGQGYKVMVDHPTTLTYPANGNAGKAAGSQ